MELVRQTVITSAHLGRNVLTMATKKTAAERLRLGGHPRTRMMMHTDTDNRSKDRDHPRSSLTRTNTYDTETTRLLKAAQRAHPRRSGQHQQPARRVPADVDRRVLRLVRLRNTLRTRNAPPTSALLQPIAAAIPSPCQTRRRFLHSWRFRWNLRTLQPRTTHCSTGDNPQRSEGASAQQPSGVGLPCCRTP